MRETKMVKIEKDSETLFFRSQAEAARFIGCTKQLVN